ncbi:hypothetical protein ACQP3L_39845, partial [Escherichia coli]
INFMYCLLSTLVEQNTSPKQLGEADFSGSQFQGTINHGKKSWQQKPGADGHIVYTVRKQ